MFQIGASELFVHTKKLLEVVTEIIKALPQNLSISGHTDSTKFGAGGDFSNWELSADRANAARRWLEQIGMPESRIDRVVGKAATEPLVKDNPTHPSNRRLSIVMLRGTGKDNPLNDPNKVKKAPVQEQPQKEEVLPGLNQFRQREIIITPDGDPANNRNGSAAPAPAGGLPGLALSLIRICLSKI